VRLDGGGQVVSTELNVLKDDGMQVGICKVVDRLQVGNVDALEGDLEFERLECLTSGFELSTEELSLDLRVRFIDTRFVGSRGHKRLVQLFIVQLSLWTRGPRIGWFRHLERTDEIVEVSGGSEGDDEADEERAGVI